MTQRNLSGVLQPVLGSRRISARLLLIGLVCCGSALTAACSPVKADRDDAQPAAHEPPTAPVSPVLIPGVVVDPARNVVYIMRPAAGIEAVDVATGALRWTSTLAEQPLFVAAGTLVARVASTAPGLAVASLDAESGDRVGKNATQTLPLPPGVVAGIDDTLERNFRHSIARSHGDFVLSWEFIERDVTGVAPADGSAFSRRESGAFLYSDGEFSVTSAPSDSPATDDWPNALRTLFEAKRIRGFPWKTKGLLAIAEQYYDPERLVLRRWRRDDGQPLPDRTLFEGRALAVLAACDEQYIVAAVPSGASVPEAPYLLRYYKLDSGELVSEVTSRRSAGPFCVLGQRLLTVSPQMTQRKNGALVKRPLQLVAFDLVSGAEVWRRAVRDTAFRGTAPPLN